MDQKAIDLLVKAALFIGIGDTDEEKAKWLIDYAAQGARQYHEDLIAEVLTDMAGFDGMGVEG